MSRSSEIDTRVGANSATCLARPSRSRPAASALTENRSLRDLTTERVLRPIEPVQPRILIFVIRLRRILARPKSGSKKVNDQGHTMASAFDVRLGLVQKKQQP